MKLCVKLLLLLCFVSLSYETYSQNSDQITTSQFDSLINEVRKLTKYDSGSPVIFGKLENYCSDIRLARFDSIYESNGGKIIRYPDSPELKRLLCDSISIHEKIVFDKFVYIKMYSTDDMLVDLALKSSSEIALSFFLLLCSDDNPKSKKVLDHYLLDKSEIWIEDCERRKKQKVRDFMLDRLFLCLTYDGRIPMITEKELAGYLKIAKDYKSPWTIMTK